MASSSSSSQIGTSHVEEEEDKDDAYRRMGIQAARALQEKLCVAGHTSLGIATALFLSPEDFHAFIHNSNEMSTARWTEIWLSFQDKFGCLSDPLRAVSAVLPALVPPKRQVAEQLRNEILGFFDVHHQLSRVATARALKLSYTSLENTLIPGHASVAKLLELKTKLQPIMTADPNSALYQECRRKDGGARKKRKTLNPLPDPAPHVDRLQSLLAAADSTSESDGAPSPVAQPPLARPDLADLVRQAMEVRPFTVYQHPSTGSMVIQFAPLARPLGPGMVQALRPVSDRLSLQRD